MKLLLTTALFSAISLAGCGGGANGGTAATGAAGIPAVAAPTPAQSLSPVTAATPVQTLSPIKHTTPTPAPFSAVTPRPVGSLPSAAPAQTPLVALPT